MTTRMAETFLPYLTLSIYDTPVILRYVINAVPYGSMDLLRIYMGYIGEVTGGASPSPTMGFICFAINRDRSETLRYICRGGS